MNTHDELKQNKTVTKEFDLIRDVYGSKAQFVVSVVLFTFFMRSWHKIAESIHPLALIVIGLCCFIVLMVNYGLPAHKKFIPRYLYFFFAFMAMVYMMTFGQLIANFLGLPFFDILLTAN